MNIMTTELSNDMTGVNETIYQMMSDMKNVSIDVNRTTAGNFVWTFNFTDHRETTFLFVTTDTMKNGEKFLSGIYIKPGEIPETITTNEEFSSAVKDFYNSYYDIFEE